MCASHVYKRRKLQNSIALLSNQNAMKNSKKRSICDYIFGSKNNSLPTPEDDMDPPRGTIKGSLCGCPLMTGNHPMSFPPGPIDHVTIFNSIVDENTDFDSLSREETLKGSPIGEERVVTEVLTRDPQRPTSDESCSSSKSNLENCPSLKKIEEEDIEESSSSAIKATEQLTFSTSKELCIDVLKTDGLIGGAWPSDKSIPSEILGGNDAKFCLPCKVCGVSDNPRRMLICDNCEKAFHLSCCQEKKPFKEAWYCRPCYQKKPSPLLDALAGKSFHKISDEYKIRIMQQELGPIVFMLKDTRPYTTKVRIGKDYQANVPDWSGPVSKDYDCFGQPSKLDPKEYATVNGWSSTNFSKSSSIGNWIQCKEVIDIDMNGNGIVCGKWRRAPLFVTQTDDWDCSCSVVWDPIHADCVVPQELGTEEILRHLKYVELLRTRLDKKHKSG